MSTASWYVELFGTHVLQNECHIAICLLICNSWQWNCQKNDSHQWFPKVWYYWYTHPLGCTILGRNWCSEAAGVSFNLHWLFHCVTNTHLTDGSTQRITEPCWLLGNTCPLLQTFHNHTHYLNSTPTYEQRHWCWLMQLLPQQKQTCSFWDWYSAHSGRNNVSSRMQDKVLQLQQFHQGWQIPD